MVDQRLDDVSSARADLPKGMQGSIPFHESWVRETQNDDIHEIGDVPYDSFTTDTRKFTECHEDIGGHSRVRIAGFRKKYTNHRDSILLDKALCCIDEEGQDACAFFAVPAEPKVKVNRMNITQ